MTLQAQAEAGVAPAEPAVPLGVVALPSRHALPRQGNWVRLASDKQQAAAAGGAAARAAGGWRLAAGDGTGRPRGTFGHEARRSASQRWSHQTPLPFTKRAAAADGPEAPDVPGAAALARALPGSFLPLRMATAAELRGGEAVSSLVPHTEGVEAAQQDDWRTQEAWVPGVSTSRIQKKVMD